MIRQITAEEHKSGVIEVVECSECLSDLHLGAKIDDVMDGSTDVFCEECRNTISVDVDQDNDIVTDCLDPNEEEA